MNRSHENSGVRARGARESDDGGAGACERIGRHTGIQSRSLEYVDMVVVGGAHRLTGDGIRSAGIYRVRCGRNSRRCDAATFNVHDRNVTRGTAPTALRDVCSHIISYYERGQRARPQAGTLRNRRRNRRAARTRRAAACALNIDSQNASRLGSQPHEELIVTRQGYGFFKASNLLVEIARTEDLRAIENNGCTADAILAFRATVRHYHFVLGRRLAVLEGVGKTVGGTFCPRILLGTKDG